jgi:FkbM family methyltransferase
VDIGANIGAFTLEAAARYPDAPIHAYEPDPISREVLRHNVAANRLERRVSLWPEAVAGADGTLEFHHSGASLESGAHASSGPGIRVPCVSLRTVLARLDGAAGLMKIDAEGAEVEMLEAASAPPAAHLVGEFHPWLVERAEQRLRDALTPAFEVEFVVNRRCGTMFTASLKGSRG